MFLKHLINPKPSIMIFFIIFCLLFAISPLVNLELSLIFRHNYLTPLIVFFLALIAPILLSIGLNNIVYENNIIRKENLVIGCVFILISCTFVNVVEAWIASFFLLFIFNFLVKSYQKDLPFSQFYNASFLLGVITFIYPNFIFLLFLLIISSINYSNLNWRIIITIFLGLGTPYFFYFVFVFLTDKTYLPFIGFDVAPISILAIYNAHLSKIIWLVVLLIVTLFSFFEIFIWLYKKSIKSRRTFMTIIWFFIITILVAIYSGSQYFYFSFLPLAIIIGNYFVYTKRRLIANSLFFLLLISSFYYRYMIVFNV
tara:strand:- start:190 stop:1128 length:939 start_codon:yes stop_codon:yes gene_type:complete